MAPLFTVSRAIREIDEHIPLTIEIISTDATHLYNLQTRLRNFPKIDFDFDTSSYLISDSPKNLDYLFTKFSFDEYELDSSVTELFPETFLRLMNTHMGEYKANNNFISIPYEPKTKPFAHQHKVLAQIHTMEFFALLWEMGTGKTKVVIDEVFWCASENTRKLNILVICPKTILLNWRKEIEIHGLSCETTILKTNTPGVRQLKKLYMSKKQVRFVLCGVDRVTACKEFLKMVPWDLAVLDESHKIKSPKTKRSHSVREIAPFAKRRAILTGTVVGNKASDMYPQFDFLHKGLLGYDSYRSFDNAYGYISAGNIVNLLKNYYFKKIKQRLDSVASIVLKKECLDLPEKMFDRFPVEMTEKQTKAYDQMATIMIAMIEDEGEITQVKAQMILVQLLRLTQITSGFFKNTDTPPKNLHPIDEIPKIQAVQTIINGLPENEKLIIWARFRQDIDNLFTAIPNSAIIDGRTPQTMRQDLCDNFNSNNGIRVLIAQPGCAGEGITLIGTKENPCSHVIRYSHDFSILKVRQSEDRCHRIGMHTAVNYIDLYCEGTIDESILNALKRKRNLGDAFSGAQTINKNDLTEQSIKSMIAGEF